MIINIDADSGVDAHFTAVCDSVDDANLLSAACKSRPHVPALSGKPRLIPR